MRALQRGAAWANDDVAIKVPAVTLGFWIVKIAATTLGETAGDTVSMSMQLGYLAATGIFAIFLVAAVGAQMRATRFNAWLYWSAIIATTTVGTTLADFADRSLGIGYPGGTLLLLGLLLGSLFAWHKSLGTISITSVSSPAAEAFYWMTVMFSQTLGTALGDWTADTAGLGYTGGIAIFVGLLAVVAAAYRWTRISHTLLFWAAFVLTRPLGAVVGSKASGTSGLRCRFHRNARLRIVEPGAPGAFEVGQQPAVAAGMSIRDWIDALPPVHVQTRMMLPAQK